MSLGFRNLKNSRARRRLTCKTQDQAKTAEVRYSESSDDSDGSKQYPNNTKTKGAVCTAAEAKRGATEACVGAPPPTAADDAGGAGGRALWVVSTR